MPTRRATNTADALERARDLERRLHELLPFSCDSDEDYVATLAAHPHYMDELERSLSQEVR
jgi:hypothetical protein